ncbi:MAG: hypothetical protein ACYTG0_23175, partial [Planctomycetota bacterium]
IGTVRATGSVGTEVVYAIGERAELAITLSYPRFWADLLYVFTRIARNPLLKKIEEALGRA